MAENMELAEIEEDDALWDAFVRRYITERAFRQHAHALVARRYPDIGADLQDKGDVAPETIMKYATFETGKVRPGKGFMWHTLAFLAMQWDDHVQFGTTLPPAFTLSREQLRAIMDLADSADDGDCLAALELKRIGVIGGERGHRS